MDPLFFKIITTISPITTSTNSTAKKRVHLFIIARLRITMSPFFTLFKRLSISIFC